MSVIRELRHDEVTGQEYSAQFVEQYALAALKPSGPWVFNSDALQKMAVARAQSSDDIHFVGGVGWNSRATEA